MVCPSRDIPTVYTDGVLDVVNLGATCGVTYFEYVRARSGLFVKVPSFRMIRPKDSVIAGIITAMLANQPDPRGEMKRNN